MSERVGSLSAEEKIRLLAGKDEWHTETLEGRLYEVTLTDGPMGVRMPYKNSDGTVSVHPATAFPSSQILAQTWCTELAYETGKMIASECIAYGADVLLAPGINIQRNPFCGRNFEYFSEDPYLSGVFGREYIRGVQSLRVGATVKHYCANNQEFCRQWQSSEVDERTLREIYLKPFELALQAKPLAVMCAYNLVNGVRMSEHKKLFSVLRNEFGFDGLIVSDWDAVKDRAASLKAGLDLEMPYSKEGYENLKTAYEERVVTIEEINTSTENVLNFIERCERNAEKRENIYTNEDRLRAAQKVAEEGIVLLKNNGVLPLKKDMRISVTGAAAVEYQSGGGSSCVKLRTVPESLPDVLQKLLPTAEISYKGTKDNHEQLYAAIHNAYGKDAAIVCVSESDSESFDRSELRLSAIQ